MNYGMIFRIVGRVVGIEAAVMLVPVAVSYIYGESIKGFLVAIMLALIVSVVLMTVKKPSNKMIFSKEGFASVAASWVVISLIGAVPFVVEGAIPNYIDALFETISGFTTTGSTILTDIESMGRGLLFWRSLTHWIGGMGILVLMMAIIPMVEQYSMYIMRAEVPGPVAGKLVPKVQDSSKILYIIYVALTVLETIMLLLGKMPLYDAVIHAFGTAGTGGFSIKNESIGYYNSAYIEIVIGIFMALFGINFNLYFFMVLRKFKLAFRNEELYTYLGVMLFSTVTIALNIRRMYDGFGLALRHAFFQVCSIISTTGYSTADFDKWPQYSRILILMLMFSGACAGSTAGGMKLSRIIVLLHAAQSEIKRLLRPKSYNPVMLDRQKVDQATITSTMVYFFLYMFTIAVVSILLSFDNFNAETTITSVITCLSNVGPGLSLIGPSGNFAMFSWHSKLLLSLCMLFGRLEIFPMLMLFSPYTWKRSSKF